MGSLLDPIKDWFSSLVENVLYRIFYFLETLILRFVALVEDTMMIFTGEKTITYESKDTTLIDVFFNHDSIIPLLHQHLQDLKSCILKRFNLCGIFYCIYTVIYHIKLLFKLFKIFLFIILEFLIIFINKNLFYK